MWQGLVVSGLVAVVAVEAAAQAAMTIGGRQVEVATDDMGDAELRVDGAVLLQDGVIYLDPEAQAVGGVPVVTGVAGAGGNACGAAPFVLALPEGAEPVLYGPIDSCREFSLAVQPEALVFSTEPLPSEAGEIWVWNPVSGLTEALPEEFAADPGRGWESLGLLAGAHPVEAMQLAPVLAALQAGLGDQYPLFAERISDLGSGDLTADGYLGRACLKYTCDEDWAVLYLDRATEGVFAVWHVGGEVGPHFWPEDPHLWPPEAAAALTVE
jgi:hypothetical protein